MSKIKSKIKVYSERNYNIKFSVLLMPSLNTQETKQLKGSEAFIFEIEMNYSKMVFKGIVL